MKDCICGTSIPMGRDLCASCLNEYGRAKMLWPKWLKFLVADRQREFDYDRAHADELTLEETEHLFV